MNGNGRPKNRSKRKAVLVICDGLRPDMITPEHSPVLFRLNETACNYIGHTSVFPSSTRVTAASITTGCWPSTHGLAGDRVALQENGRLICLNTDLPQSPERLKRAGGRTLFCSTLPERLSRHGECVLFSNGPPGVAYFFDPEGFGYVYHRAGSFGPGKESLSPQKHLSVEEGRERDEAMTRRFCREILGESQPALSVLWLSEPDFSGHCAPLGSPRHLQALSGADRCVGAVLDRIQEIDRELEHTLLLICSDHGAESVRRTIPLERMLLEAGLKESPVSGDVVVAANGTAALLYIMNGGLSRRENIRDFLNEQDWVERTFTGSELEEVKQSHSASLEIAVTARYGEEENEYGVSGYSGVVGDSGESHDLIGLGHHGGLGPHERRPFLFALGSDFKRYTWVESPTSPADLAPTILKYLKLPADEMEGKPIF